MKCLQSPKTKLAFIIISAFSLFYDIILYSLIFAQDSYTIAIVSGLRNILLGITVAITALSLLTMAAMWMLYCNFKRFYIMLAAWYGFLTLAMFIFLIVSITLSGPIENSQYLSCTSSTPISEFLNEVIPLKNTFGIISVCPLKTIKNLTAKTEIINRLAVPIIESDSGYSYLPNDSNDTCYKHAYPNKSIDPKAYQYYKYLESKYSCSGLCVVSPLYYFTNVNNGVPYSTCLQYVNDELNRYVKNYSYSLAILFILVGLLFSMTLIRALKYRSLNILPEDIAKVINLSQEIAHKDTKDSASEKIMISM